MYWASFSIAEVLNPLGTFILGTHLWVIVRVGLVVALLNPRVDGAWRIYKAAVPDQGPEESKSEEPEKEPLLAEPKKSM